MTRTSGFVCAAVSLAAISVVLADQSPRLVESPSTMLRVETRVVQVDVVATDSHNKPIANLSKQDFVLTDNGKVRAIDIFSANGGEAETAAPVVRPSVSSGAKVFSNRNPGPPAVPPHSTVIVLDQVNAFFDDAESARQNVLDLLHKLPADEQIALYVIGRPDGLLMVHDYTVNHSLIIQSLTKYRPRHIMQRPVEWPANVQDLMARKADTGDQKVQSLPGRAYPPDAAKPPQPPQSDLPPEYYEDIWKRNADEARLSLQALADHLALRPGRKNVYWVTQAFPARLMSRLSTAKGAWDKTLTALNEANVAVNTVDSRGLFGGSSNTSPTMQTMSRIAEATGGKAYFNRNDLDGAIAEGMAASRVSYTLGFYLPEGERDQAFHALKIIAARPGVNLYYRQGYYAGNTDMEQMPGKAGKGVDLQAALLNQVDATGLGLTAGVNPVGNGLLQIKLTLDPATLSLKEKNGVSVGHVEEMIVEQNESGNMLVKISDTRDFEINSANRMGYDARGVSWPLSVPLKAGATKVSVIVRDSVMGKIGSLTIPLQ